MVLVTGVPGWLGSRLVEILCQQMKDGTSDRPRRVRCLVLPGLATDDLAGLPIELVGGDVRVPAMLPEALRGVETVFHLAGVIHAKRVRELYDINTEGTRNLISAAVEAGVKRFVYISSNSAVGHNTNWGRPMTEEDPPQPYKHYGRSKLQAERIISEYYDEGAIETVILRPCWYYGTRQPARQTRFFRMIKSGKPIFFGDGTNERSMAYIDNVTEALLLAESFEHANGQTYWIADERPYQTLEIYRTVADLLGVDLRPRFLPAFSSTCCEWIDTILQVGGLYSTNFHVAGEMAKDISCSVEKAKRELGYRPRVGLEEGMKNSIEWCRSNGIEI